MINSNSVGQQPIRDKAYCAHPSIRDHWVLRSTSKYLDQVVSLKRDPQYSSPQASFGTHLSTHCSRDERLSRPCPAREQNPDLWCGSAICYHSTTRPQNHD
ncbi:hypothetical protein TNCV_5132511 [Trichonephila clavipes]|nr:hypothetical protein TNCV_5132511 [Trichonephila clavipes]